MTPKFNKLLVLDLDETLYFVTKNALPARREDFFINGSKDIFWGYHRPHVKEFLEYVFESFTVGIWTSSTFSLSLPFVKNLLTPEQFDRLAFKWDRSSCIYYRDLETFEDHYIKDIRKLKKRYDIRHILFVDDTPFKIKRSYGNYIRVKPYLGQEDDRELADLIPYLETLGPVDNVRTIEKRTWRSTVK